MGPPGRCGPPCRGSCSPRLEIPAPRACWGASDGSSTGPASVTSWKATVRSRPTSVQHGSSRAGKTTRGESVLEAIVRYRDQLKQRGIELVVMPVPEKASVYPDMLTRRAEGRADEFRSPTEDLLARLAPPGGGDDGPVCTLSRGAPGGVRVGQPTPLYLARDTHWTPAGVRLAAGAMAARLRELGRAPRPRESTLSETWRSSDMATCSR